MTDEERAARVARIGREAAKMDGRYWDVTSIRFLLSERAHVMAERDSALGRERALWDKIEKACVIERGLCEERDAAIARAEKAEAERNGPVTDDLGPLKAWTKTLTEQRDAALAQVKRLRARVGELEGLAEGLVSGRLKRWDRSTIVGALQRLALGFQSALAATEPKLTPAQERAGEFIRKATVPAPVDGPGMDPDHFATEPKP